MNINADVDILAYHSIADGCGPLAIPPDTFRMQLDALAELGFRGTSLREWLTAPPPREGSDRPVVLTFDDGYQDVADVAAPEIVSRGWTCTVFLASKLVGAPGGWDPDGSGKRPLIDWPTTDVLVRRGIEIGGHGVSHADLTKLSIVKAREEIAGCKKTLEERTGCRVTSFAAPYGRTTPEVRIQIAGHYDCAVSTTMARAASGDDLYNLPRIDMWYFRDPVRWRAYLEGSTTYFTLRRVLRQARIAAGF